MFGGDILSPLMFKPLEVGKVGSALFFAGELGVISNSRSEISVKEGSVLMMFPFEKKVSAIVLSFLIMFLWKSRLILTSFRFVTMS